MDQQRKRKVVWRYFEEDPSGNKAEAACLFCGEFLKHHGTISSLIRHLKSKHSSEVDIAELLKADSGGASSAKQRRIEETKQKLANSADQKMLLDQFMAMVAVDLQPDSSLDTDYQDSNPLRKKRSPIWKYFKAQPGNKQANCTLCRETLRHHGNTTNLMKHLRARHSAEAATLHLDHGIGLSFRSDTDSASRVTANNISTLCKIKTEKSGDVKQTNSSLTLARNKILDQKLLSLIVVDLHPVSVLESKCFINLMKVADGRYNIPNRQKIDTELLPNLYKETVDVVLKKLDNIKHLALTTELWSPRNQESYLSVTAHFICPNEWTLKSVMLSTTAFYGNPAGKHISSELQRTANEWSITDKVRVVIVDKETNTLLSACNEHLPWAYIPCLAHLIQLVVTNAISEDVETVTLIDKVGDIVRFFKQDNETREKLKEAQKSLDLPEHKLILHVATRWNSIYFMLDRILEQMDAVNAVLEAYDKFDMYLSSEDGDIMKKIVSSLKPFDIATKTLSSEKSSTVGTALPLVKGLLKMMTSVTNVKEPLAGNLKQGLMGSFGKIEDIEWIVAATVLDPRFKKFPYTDKGVIDRATEVVSAEFAKMVDDEQTESETNNDAASKIEEDSLWMYLDVMTNSVKEVRKPKSSANFELQRYFESPPIPRDDNPFLYWKQHQELYPNLCKLAMKYMTVPITSIPCDRLFTKAGESMTERRSRLKAKNVNMMMFLNRNLSYTGLSSH